MEWRYEKLVDGKVKTVDQWTIDSDRCITGAYVVNVKAWFDEHPDYWKENGWVKHIRFEPKEIKERWPFNPQTQVLLKNVRTVDEYTVEDDYHAIDKSEEMMRLQEMLYVCDPFDGPDSIVFYGADE